MAFETVPADKHLKLAVLLHIQYESYDLVCRVLAAVDAQQSTNYAQRHISVFIRPPTK